MAEPGRTASAAARRFRVREVLGAGAFGTVYRADALSAGDFTKPVAIKVLHQHHEAYGHLVRRLRDEARMLARLKHRAIVRIDDLVQLDGSWAIVMELVDGVDLGRVVARGPLPPGPALEVIQEVASALRVAWEQPGDDGAPLRLLHRDIKPSNLALTPTGEIRVLDFGIAKAELPDRESKTRSMLLGTPAYMAPECFEYGPEHASDVYALGATLYELLTGEMLGRTSMERDRHAARIEEALAGLGGLPGGLLQLLRDMLGYPARERPTARDVERRARDLRASLGEPWLTDWAPDAVADVRGAAPPPDASVDGSLLEEGESRETFHLEVPPVAEPTRSRALPLALLGAGASVALAVVAAVGVVGVAWWWNRRPDPVGVGPDPVVAGPAPVVEADLGPRPADVAPPDPAPEVTAPRDADRPAPAPARLVPEPAREVAEPVREVPEPAPHVADPAPEVDPEPAPVAPEPAPEAPSPVRALGVASVGVTGAAERVVLISGDRRAAVPGDVEAGTWQIEATFTGRDPAVAGRVTLLPGQSVTIDCQTGFFLCQGR